MTMVREAIQKKSVQSVLIILVVGIWIYNSWKIFSIPGDNDVIWQAQTLDVGEGENLNIPDAFKFEFTGNFRDPFLPLLESTAVPQPENNRKPEVIEPEPLPEFTLTGIFENTVILQDRNGGVHLAEPGDSIGQVILNSINSNSITLSFRNRIFTIQLHTEHNEDLQ